MVDPEENPRLEYAQRLAARREAAALCLRRHITAGNLRLAVVLAAAALGYASIFRGALSVWWLAAPAAVFLTLAVYHERVLRAKRFADRAARFYEKAIARIEDRWAGTGESGTRYRDAGHPYAEDLDLFGSGGLFELLSTARTLSGEETLARWLLAPAPPEAVRERHTGITELRGRLDFREDLGVLGEDVRTGVHPHALVSWAEAPAILDSWRAWVAAWVLSGLMVLAVVVLWQGGGKREWLVLGMLAVNAGFALALRRRVQGVLAGAEAASHDLALLSAVLARLEGEPYQSPRLVKLRASLEVEGRPPSKRIERLNRIMELVDSRDNLLLRLFGPPLLYSTHLAFALEAWRRHSGRLVRQWLEAVGEIEALSALAGYSFEHPADPFPEFTEAAPCFEAAGLGHPLLAESRCVRNDVRLGGALRLLLVSGSNMSGKSTLLRSVGVNAVLAMAGAPVRAIRLRLSPLTVGASMRATDSLQGGVSRFYAEITRLRRLVDLASGSAPLLFLIDELLHGTNSHDRRIGAEAVVRSLLNRGAIGLVTTHDLALTEVAGALGPLSANVHFQDHLDNGRIAFDYRLQPGIVTKSNALELMRSIGLDV